ncbi:MAG: hypothetical protein EOM05_04975 [Clostridia bacterium]|nr:hypothetical protein [Clostridia bacterium]
MRTFILKYWVEFLFSSGLGVLSIVVKLMFNRLKRLSLVEHGMQALLKDRIIQAYNHNIKQGYCPIYSLESILDMYEQYHALGGNGTITRLVAEIQKLPTQPMAESEKEN